MRALKAFALGAAAVAVAGYVTAASVAMAAQAGGRSVHVALGPLVLVTVARHGTTVETVFGGGIALLALLGGMINLAAAELVGRRAGREADRVD